MPKKYDNSMLDEAGESRFPSFVTEIKKAAKMTEMANDELGVLEKCYREKKTHWKHGGIVGVRGYARCYRKVFRCPEEFRQ